MRVFVTGASGHIGSAVVPELLRHGHQVTGLARSDASAAALEAAGAQVHRGDLDDLDGLHAAAAAADGVIHLAFKHEAMMAGDFMTAVTDDLRAVQAMASAIEGSGKPFVGTGGTAMLALSGAVSGRAGTEQDRLTGGPRVEAENTALGLAGRGVRSSWVRLPPVVHSELPGSGGFAIVLIGIARATGVSACVGDGANRWPAVNTVDAARLYRLALESAPAGSVLHGVAEEGIAVRDIAEVIGRHLNLPVKSIDPADAAAHFGMLGAFAGLDNPSSSALTRQLLDWQPTGAGLFEDLERGHYFDGAAG
jgi:nucleoside-diphosphate-sugar epimerase